MTKQIKVKFDVNKTSVDSIQQALAIVGYDSEKHKAFKHDIDVTWYHCDQDGCDFKSKQKSILNAVKRVAKIKTKFNPIFGEGKSSQKIIHILKSDKFKKLSIQKMYNNLR